MSTSGVRRTLWQEERTTIQIFLVFFYISFALTEIFTYNNIKVAGIPILFLSLFLPLFFFYWKKNQFELILYTVPVAYLLVSLIRDFTYYGDLYLPQEQWLHLHITELILIWFAPLFLDRLYLILVSICLFLQYVCYGLYFEDSSALFKLITIGLLCAISWFLLLRFQSAAKRMLSSYDRQVETLASQAEPKELTTGSAVLNHTIKNEIMTISMHLRKLMDDASSNHLAAEDMEDRLQKIQTSADHMKNMIQRINHQMQDLHLDPAPNNLSNILDMAVSVNGLYAERRGCSIKRVYPDDSDDIILSCDGTHMLEVLNNIIKNGLESMSAGGVIEIDLRQSEKYITLIISDRGQGMDQETLERVYEPFFSTKMGHDNYGLGLSYCYNVMHKCGGTIRMQSETGRGTSVELHFPLSMIMTAEEVEQMRLQ